jgi:hypothetical protein
MTDLTRRAVLGFLAAPAIVRVGNIMPVHAARRLSIFDYSTGDWTWLVLHSYPTAYWLDRVYELEPFKWKQND